MGCAAGKPASQVLPADDSKSSKAAEPAPPAAAAATTGEAAEALPREARLEDLFDACDDDGSGALSLDEFSQIFDDKMAKTDIAVQLKEVDAEGVKDGKLTKEEFVAYHLKKFELVDEATFSSIMDALITKAEDAEVIDDAPAVAGEEAAAEEPAAEEAAPEEAAAEEPAAEPAAEEAAPEAAAEEPPAAE